MSIKDPTSSDNYCLVALAPALSKALEWSILLLYHFTTADSQFGLKKVMSTALCTGFIKNVVSKFVHSSSSVFGCFLDASKAFDCVNHDILFSSWWRGASLQSWIAFHFPGIKVKGCKCAGMLLFLLPFQCQMESGKGESCHQFCLPFTWMICCWVLRVWVLVVIGMVSLLEQPCWWYCSFGSLTFRLTHDAALLWGFCRLLRL